MRIGVCVVIRVNTVYFHFLWDHRALSGYFENRIPVKPVLVGWGSGWVYAASQTTLLFMKRLMVNVLKIRTLKRLTK